MGKDFKYSAFISYSHTDKKIVQWLHRALESYRLPGHLANLETSDGIIPKKLKPFFRDRDDLAAATNLTDSVRQAMKQSEFLIVVCSPNAAKSKWVNKEILEFKKLRGQEKILCLIIDGQPNTTSDKSIKAQECFPPALRKKRPGQRFEPIAADARPTGDGKRLAKLKLIAGILGIELDRLVQRDTQRHQRRQAGILAATVAGVMVLSVLLVFAIEARKDADEKRAQAENLVEFMIGDLNDKLAPTGSLEIMDSIAQKALDYYASLDPNELDEISLGSRSRALQIIGGIENTRGNIDQATVVFTEAFETTEELLSRNPNDPDRIFDHSQSLFWLGFLVLQKGDLDKTEVYFQGYADYADQLITIDPENTNWQTEVGYAHSNLGTLYLSSIRYEEADKEFAISLDIFFKLSRQFPNSLDYQYELAQSYAWQADAKQNLIDLKAAEALRVSEKSIYENILARDQTNNFVKSALLVTHRVLGVLFTNQGNIEQAIVEYTAGLKLGNELLALSPDNTRWTYWTASLYMDFSEIYLSLGDLEKASRNLGEVRSLVDVLYYRDPEFLDWQINSINRWELINARIFQKQGDHQKAIDVVEPVSLNLELVRDQNPLNRDVLIKSIEAHYILSESYGALGLSELQKKRLNKIIELIGKNEKTVGLKGHFLAAKAYLTLGLIDQAQQKALYLDSFGYRNPEYMQFRKNFFAN